MRITLKVCLALVGIFISITLFSQGIQDSVFHIGEVQKTAKYIFKKEEAGMKESKIDSLAFMDKITGDLSALLQQNTTIYIKSHGRGALSTASFRGTAPTHTKVTWNGMPINSPMLGMVDFSTIPVFVLDGAGIEYGGASISSNGGALGGNINLYNAPDWNNRFSARLLTGIGSYSTYNLMGQVNLGNQLIQSKTRFYHMYSENNYDIINTSLIGHPETQNENADYTKTGILQEIYLRFHNKWTGSAKMWYQDGNRAIPMVMSYEGADSTSRGNKQADITLKSVAQVKYYGEKFETEIRSGYDYQQLDYVMSIDVGGLGTQKPVNSGSDMRGWYNNATAKYTLSEKVLFQASADANYFNITSLDSANQTGYDEQRMEYSFFAGAYFHPFDLLNFSAELRRDIIPNTSPPLIFNFGVSLKPLKKTDLVWKSSFCQNFHSPSLNDLYWMPGGNPDLLPEEGYSFETGLHYVYHNHQNKFDVQLTGYYSDISNWILWLPSVKGYWEAMNLKQVLSKGIEVNTKYSIHVGELQFKAQANYAYTSTTNQGEPLNNLDASMGMQLPFIPKHSLNALVYAGYKNSFITFQHQYYGVRNLLSSNMATLDDDSGDESTVPFYRLYAVPLQYATLGHKQKVGDFMLTAEFKVNNLFNETYRSILNRFMPRRNYELLLTFNF